MRFQDLLLSAATLALMKGFHSNIVSDLLGHGTAGLTLHTHFHLLPAMHQQAATAMDAILAGQPKSLGVPIGVVVSIGTSDTGALVPPVPLFPHLLWILVARAHGSRTHQ